MLRFKLESKWPDGWARRLEGRFRNDWYGHRNESRGGSSGPAILDTAGPLYNLHYLNALGSPRSPNQRKFSAVLSGKGWNALSVPIGGGGSRMCTQNAQAASSGEDRINPAANLPDWTIHKPFYSGRQPATLLRSALKVLESAKYPTIQFRHITCSCVSASFVTTTCSIRRSTCRSCCVQFPWTITPHNPLTETPA